MTKPFTKSSGQPSLLRRSACGVIVAALAWTTGIDVASAQPAPAHHTTPLLQQVVGLRQGASGDDVKAVQQALISAGIAVAGGADGLFGPATRRALLQFQEKEGLPASGEVDDATAVALGLASAPPTSSGTAAVNGLQQGSSGDAVRELQEQLTKMGVWVPGGVDGQFGSGTRTAVRNFQRWNGLTVSGVVDAATATRLGLTGSSTASGTATQPPAPVTPDSDASGPSSSSDSSHIGLAIGSQGELVKDLQSALIAAGVTVPGGADGIFGNATKTALSRYQRANGLGVSGVVYPATAKKLGLGSSSTATPTTTPPADPPTSPPATGSDGYVGLSEGAVGPAVKELQEALMETGLVIRGGADGVFGASTTRALKFFQQVNGFSQTGVVSQRDASLMALGDSSSQPNGVSSTGVGFPKKGESSERVRVMQQLLIDWGISVRGGADGSFGNATAAAITKFQQTHGLTATGTITEGTAKKMGLSAMEATPPPASGAVKLERFPLQGQCYFGNTWHAPRGGGRLHEGVDLIAAEGNLLYAVVDGTITKQYWDQPGALAGNGLRLSEDNGTYYTYLHMLSFAPGIKVGTKVKAGDVIGFNGNTGSSATAHLHFEIHPGGGAAVNPYPYIKAMDECNNTTPQYQTSYLD